MRFLSAVHTDIGITKKVNQDAFCLKIAKTPSCQIAFAVLCDGMGGLKNGELASAFVVNAFSRWFEDEFPLTMQKTSDFNVIKNRWNEIVVQLNQKIGAFGKQNGFSLGTTLTGVLVVNNNYICIQVGDSRLYKIDSSSIQQITKDQTVVALEIAQNRLTAEQAKTDKRKNMLLQCIGASNVVTPEFFFGKLNANEVFMLCSDGFRHEVSDEEIFGVLAPELLTDERVMKKSLMDLIELNKARKESDNITSIVIRNVT